MTEQVTGTEGLVDAASGSNGGETQNHEVFQGMPNSGDSGNNGGSDNSSGGINPAWSGLLETLPEGLHGVVQPYLREWDRGVQERFQQVQSQYAPLEPYKQFAESGIEPNVLESAINLYQMIDQNPEAVWRQMAEHYKFSLDGNNGASGQGQPGQENSGDFSLEDSSQPSDITQHPQFKALQQQVEQLTGGLQSAYEQQQQREQDAQLEQQISTIKQQLQIPENDSVTERMAMGLSLTGMPLEDAFKEALAYKQQAAAQSQRPAPQVMPTGGGIPSSQPDVANMGSGDTKQLLAQMLAAANRS